MRAGIALYMLLIIGCNNQSGKSKIETTLVQDSLWRDSSQKKVIQVKKDSDIVIFSKQVLTSLKNKNYQQFIQFIHPVLGVRFSPYGYIDTSDDVVIQHDKLLEKIEQNSKINWGTYDGKGDRIYLTVKEYFKKIVYNADFLNAEKQSLNKMIGGGNSLNNLVTIYKDCDFTESYFSGFEKKYEGMDWCCLRLVFKKYQDKVYLVGIVNDQWTI